MKFQVDKCKQKIYPKEIYNNSNIIRVYMFKTEKEKEKE